MLEKYTSRKLLITLLTNVITLYMAFGGTLTDAQAAAVIATVNSVYLIVNGATKKANG